MLKINNNSIFSLLVVLDVLLTAAYPVVSGTILESLLMYSIWGGSFLMLLSAFITSVKKGAFIDFFFLAFIGISVVFSMLISSGDWKSSLIGCLSYFLMLVPIFYVRFLEVNERQVSVIRKANTVKMLIFFLLAISPYAYKEYYAGKFLINAGELTMGFPNPNMLGMLLLSTLAVRLYFVKGAICNSDIKRKSIYVISVAGLVYLIYLTRSRISTLLAFILLIFTLAHAVNFSSMQRMLGKRMIAVIATIAPLLFIGVFYGLYERTQGRLLIMGEAVFSRITLYNNAFSSIKDGIIVGKVNMWKFQNMHNSLLTVLVNTGIFGLVAYLQFMCYALMRYAKYIRKAEKPDLIAYATVLLLCVQSCVEAAFVAGGPIFAVGTATIYYLCEINKRR